MVKSAKATVATVVELVRRNGRPVLTGKANIGYCAVCEKRTLFVEKGPWLPNEYLCARCDSVPRWRAMILALDKFVPNWRSLDIHECGAGGPATWKIRREAPGFTGSQYLIDQYPRGAMIGKISCQDIEDMTFPDASFDLFLTQDVLEHVLRPERAFAEIARVLRPTGHHVFTLPIYRRPETLVRVAPGDGGMEFLLPVDYHGEPGNPERSLVMREWGEDVIAFIEQHSGLRTEEHRYHDRSLGLDGEPLSVFVSRKPAD